MSRRRTLFTEGRDRGHSGSSPHREIVPQALLGPQTRAGDRSTRPLARVPDGQQVEHPDLARRACCGWHDDPGAGTEIADELAEPSPQDEGSRVAAGEGATPPVLDGGP